MARKDRDDDFEIDDRQNEVYTGSGSGSALTLPAGIEFFKPPKTGPFTIDVVPFKLTEAVNKVTPSLRFSPPHKWHWNVIYWRHENIGPDQGKVICAARTFGKPCPVCEARQKISYDPNPDAKKARSALNAKERQMLYVALHNERSGTTDKPRLWEVSTHNFKKQLDLFLANPDSDEVELFRTFWHPKTGGTLKIVGTEESTGDGGGKYSKYTVSKIKPRKDSLPIEFFDITKDPGFDPYSFLREPDYKRISALFHGADIEEEDDDDRDEAPRTPPKAEEPKPQRRPVRDPDDDETEPPARSQPKPIRDADEDRPAPKKAPGPKTFAEGDLVLYTDGDSVISGTVASADPARKVCKIRFEGKKTLQTFDFDDDDLQLASPVRDSFVDPDPPKKAKKPVEQPEDAPAPPPRNKPKSAWDDDEDDPKPGKR